MKSMVTDDQLKQIRDALTAKQAGKVPRAWQIAEEVKAQYTYKMDESTIRGRFISMGEPLRGGSATPPTATPAPNPTTTKAVVNVKVFEEAEIMSELKHFVPADADFDAYVERPIDTRLALHYDIGPFTGRYKYPITQGKQGTGKTFSHAFYAYKRKLPFFLFSCYEDFKLKTLFGDKTIREGTVRFQESVFVKAVQSPSVILFDEINATANQHTFDFHAMLQNRELFVKDAEDGKGKVFNLHPECRVGFAQNPKSAKYIGGNVKPSNFLGRCTFLTYPEFTPDEIVSAMGKKFNGVADEDVAKFVTFYFGIIKLIDQAELPLDISIRQLTNMIDLWYHGMELKSAIEDGLSSMLESISQPKAKDSFYRIAQGVWKELMGKEKKNE